MHQLMVNNSQMLLIKCLVSPILQDVSKSKKQIHRFVHCIAAVGRCYCVDRAEGVHNIPEGYDSVYIQPEEDKEFYKHEFIILDSNRLWPDYLIVFEYDPDGDAK